MIAAVVQARMSSCRLPGKVLRPLAGKPTLAYLLERLERCRTLDALVVATSSDSSDDPVADFCAARGVQFHRGPLANVAGRFIEVVERFGFSAFVRVTGDSPLLDQALVDRGVALFHSGEHDVVTNVFPSTFPSGQSLEVVSAKAFRRAYGLMRAAEELEHVTLFLYRNPDLFRIHNFTSARNEDDLDVSLDTEEDARLLEAILSHMRRPHWQYSSDDVTAIYRALLEPRSAVEDT